MTRSVAAVLVVVLLVSSPRAIHAQATGIQRVAWLTGCWAMTTATGTVEEHWMAPAGGAMIGTGRTVNAGKLGDYELIVLREDGDRLAFEAHPARQPVATFHSTQITSASAVFENPQHDFPQKIGYERRGDELAAYIEGTSANEVMRSDFVYKRVPCGQP